MKLKIDKKYLKIPVNTHAVTKKLCLYSNGKLIFDLDCKIDTINPNFISYINVSRFLGLEAELKTIPEMDFTLECVDKYDKKSTYSEEYRPFVHFTPERGWLNDPNGLIKYKDTYHMFFQYNPCGTEWGNMHWGHAVSSDLLHWQELDTALAPDEMGTMFSGSAFEDKNNVTGLKAGKENSILLYYTAAGNTSLLSKNQPFTQCLAYSTDGGKSFIKYDKNPVLCHIEGENRDPKVVFVPEISKYLMALYLAGNRYLLLTSDNLIDWEKLLEISIINDAECPDIFSFRFENKNHWVIMGASDNYIIGVFENGKFVQVCSEKRLGYTEYSYAAQSFSGLENRKVVRLSWDRINMPSLSPHQMSFPTELRLHRRNGELFLSANPIEEIKTLYQSKFAEKNIEIGKEPKSYRLERAAYDIYLEAEYTQKIGIRIFGHNISIDTDENSIKCGRHKIPASLNKGKIRLRILIDRCSAEIFADGGVFCATLPFLCDYNLPDIVLSAPNGVKIDKIEINKLKSCR